MLISKLTLCDFGVFRGRVTIDLAPRQTTRPIVLLGGLNGAGKTTLLSAIRLAFYGRLAAGSGMSQKSYEQYLLSLIHRSRSALVPSDGASIAIDFEHAQLGARSRYSIVRSWMRRGEGASEFLQVSKDNEMLSELTQDQLQSLLNQLVPIGIADLFFFDGEKISDLATQDRSPVLSESVKRLVGLHLVERLQSDLFTFVRQTRKLDNDEGEIELNLLIEKRDKQLEFAKLLESEIADLDIGISRLARELEEAETELGRMGGAWAKDRAALKGERERLLGEVRTIELKLREALTGEGPLALLGKQAPIMCESLRQSLRSQVTYGMHKELVKRVQKLRAKLKSAISTKEFAKAEKVVDEVFANIGSPDVGASSAGAKVNEVEGTSILNILEVTAKAAERSAQRLAEDLGRQRRLLDAIDQQITRMPEDSVIASRVASMKELERELIEAKATRLQRVREIKAAYWSCFELTRGIRRMEEKVDTSASHNRAIALAGTVHKLLDEFALVLKEAKLAQLAQALQLSFQRLARKADLIASVEFDAESFAITIRDKSGVAIPKKKLSAGEQQVFAIAVLDALLTCSGRSLPLVIDTPLGRLDSKHRERLVREYFPRAAHQVVVLSTDTEVDQKFYEGLAPHLSHSYHLRFDDESGSTTVDSGYFWRVKSQELRDAA
jgi:DNA sulfur modification protein DndD